MIIGLLLCDHVSPKLHHIDGNYPDMFNKLFPGLELTVYPVCDGTFPKSAEVCDAWIVNGSRFSVYDDTPWINQLKEFVREIRAADKYYLGICFGHQMLAEALGGKVRRSKNGWCVGVHEFEILSEESWMHPQKEKINLLMMCRDQVYQMPEGSRVLARQPECPISMFMIGSKMLGIQAHPEFSKAYDQVLIELRTKIIGKKTVEKGLASLNKATHGDIFASWAMNFFKGV